MDRNTLTISAFPGPLGEFRSTFSTHQDTPLHPALAYATEEESIHNSLDLSFQQLAAISRLDRQIIDNLSHLRR